MKLTDEYVQRLDEEIGSTSDLVNQLPDDPTYTFDVFIPDEFEFHIEGRFPNVKEARFMFGSFDNPYYDHHRKYGTCYFWWNYWLYFTLHNMRLGEVNEIKTIEPDKFIMTMNNRATTHRRFMMKWLDYYNLLTDSYFSWIRPTNWNFKRMHSTFDSDMIWSKEEKRYFLPSQTWVTKHDSPHFEDDIPKEFYRTFVNVVNETSTKVVFVTEKTWRCLLLGKPFIVNGAPNFHKSLKEKGFKLYDEIFDYSFDSIENDEKRCQQIAQQLYNLKDSDLEQLYDSIYHKLIYNQNLCKEMILNNVGIPDIKSSFLERHLNMVEISKNKIQEKFDEMFVKKLV